MSRWKRGGSVSNYGVKPFEPAHQHAEGQFMQRAFMRDFHAPHSGNMRNRAIEAYSLPVSDEAVEVSGSRSRPELNGVMGRIVGGSVDRTGKVVVRVDDGVQGVPK